MTAPDCPACEEPVEDVRKVGPVSLVLEPCGHQIDEEVYNDLFEE